MIEIGKVGIMILDVMMTDIMTDMTIDIIMIEIMVHVIIMIVKKNMIVEEIMIAEIDMIQDAVTMEKDVITVIKNMMRKR